MGSTMVLGSEWEELCGLPRGGYLPKLSCWELACLISRVGFKALLWSLGFMFLLSAMGL